MATETFVIEIRTRGTKKAAGDVKRIGTQARSVRKTLAFLRNALVAVAAIRVFASLTASLVEFSDAMLTVKAVTGATALEFARLRDIAKGLGATTRFTAGEAAEGMTFLARAGFEVNEVMSAIPAVLDLAAAATLDLGNAADIASNLMTSFGLTVSDLPDIMDTLVFTANNANTTVQQLADGMKLFAPIASQLGISLKDAAAFMAGLGDAGIQASLAGTAFRRIVTDMEAPTGNFAKALEFMGIQFDEIRPSLVGLVAGLQRLKDANVGASAATLLFGKRGGFAAAEMLRGLDATVEFRKGLDDVGGTAKTNAEIMEEGLGGALRLVRSALQNLIIAFADLGGETFLNDFFRDLAQALRVLAANADNAWAAIKALIAVLVARKVLLFVKAMILTSVSIAVAGKKALRSAREFGFMATAAKGLRTALLSIPFVAILVSLGLLITGFIAFRDQMKLMGDDGGTLNDVFQATGNLLAEELTNAVNAIGFDFADFGEIVDTVSSRVASAIEGIVAVMSGLIAAAKAIFLRVTALFKTFLLKLEAAVFRFQSGVNNLLNLAGFKDFFDLEDNKKAAQELIVEIRDLNNEIAKGGTVFENFIKGGKAFLDEREGVTNLRLITERDNAILATEDANRAAAKARAAAAIPKDAVDSGRTDLAEALRGGGKEEKARKEVERLTEALRGLEAANFPLLAVREATRDVLKTINEAEAKGIELRVEKGELIRRSIRDQIGANQTIKQAAEEQEVLSNALRANIINMEEFESLSRRSAITFLDSQRDAASGAQRAFLKFQEDVTDSAAFTEKAMTDAFKGIEDAVVEFANTGTLSINSFFRNFSEQLLRLGTQQAIAGLGSAFGGLGSTGASGGQAGPGGFITSLLGGLFGMKDGGSFTVGANSAVQSLPGIDNRLVAFRARDGEDVTITPKNTTAAGAVGPTNIVFNVQTKDADSFKRSQSQLQNRALAGINQARRRR